MTEVERLTAKYLPQIPTDSGDPEIDHGQADQVLLSLLTELGYTEIVAKFEAVKKWYA